MKYIIFNLFGCLAYLQGFASQEFEEKFYVTPGSVYVAPNAIYVNMDGHLIPVSRIAVDENGVYVEEVLAGRLTFCARCKRWWDTQVHSPFCPHNPK
jgi:hypothetical protein